MSDLKAYLVGETGEEDGFWNDVSLAFAHSSFRAVGLVYPNMISEWVAKVVDGEHNNLRVVQFPPADELAIKAGQESVLYGGSVGVALRPYGWHYEDERLCQCCGKYSEDVCSECCLCPGCRDGECDNCGGKTEAQP